MRRGQLFPPALLLAATIPLAACLTIGPDRLSHDEIGFSRALAISENEQTLLNIVRLRYAEAPTFLDLTQVISGYQSQQNVSGSFDLYPNAATSTYLGGGGSLQLQESPTFTYEPVTGEQFAATFLRPLPPDVVLPLSLGVVPIDIVFGMVVQSLNGNDNARLLTGSDSGASPRFARLLEDFRVLQVAGLLDLQLGHPPAPASARPRRHAAIHGPAAAAPDTPPGAVWMTIRDTEDPAIEASVTEARRLLGLPADDSVFDIDRYGRRPSRPHEVAMLTRSLLDVIGAAAFAITVPPRAVATGRTLPTVPSASPIAIRSGPSAPADNFVAARYDGDTYWISATDFRSKLAFEILQNLLALATTSHPTGAIVTIPAG